MTIFAAATLSGCGLRTVNSGVLPLGPDTYTISATAWSEVDARKSAFTSASKHCYGLGRELLVTETSTDPAGGVEIKFRCLNKGDPDLVRPTYTAKPDVVVEHRDD